MSANLENSAVATGLENISFHSSPQKGNAKECSNYCTIAFISHAYAQNPPNLASAVYEPRTSRYINWVSKRQRNQTSNCQHLLALGESQEIPEKNIYFCFIDCAKAFDCVYTNKLWKILKESGVPDHLTYLLRNLYVGQEITVRTRHGTDDLFKIRKGVNQGCILYPAYLTFMQSTSCGILAGWITTNCGFLKRRHTRPLYLSPEKSVCKLRSNI